MQVCFGVGAEESEGEQMGLDGVGDGKGRRGGHAMTLSGMITNMHNVLMTPVPELSKESHADNGIHIFASSAAQ